MKACLACHVEHDPLLRCERVANKEIANAPVANMPSAKQFIAAGKKLDAGRYKDPEKRKAYMRDLMRKRRKAAQ